MAKHYRVIRFGCGINGKGWAVQRDNGDMALFLSAEAAMISADRLTEGDLKESHLIWSHQEKESHHGTEEGLG